MKINKIDNLRILRCVKALLNYPLEEGESIGNSCMFSCEESNKTYIIHFQLKEFLRIKNE